MGSIIESPRYCVAAAVWSNRVNHWRPQIVNYVEGEFTVGGRKERRLYDTTRVLRSAIVRDVIGLWALSSDWANAVVDAVMAVPAWKRIALVDDCVGYRLAGTRLGKGEKLAPVLSMEERTASATAASVTISPPIPGLVGLRRVSGSCLAKVYPNRTKLMRLVQGTF